MGIGPQAYAAATASGAVFTIEEEEERSQKGSIRRPATANSRPLSDPFKDPPASPQADAAAAQRRQEVQTWVEDWASAAESMNLERSASKANSRTYSNLSNSNYHSASSGDKSDRSNSNLSERSNISGLSIAKSNAGTVSRSLSQRSGSAGYALFSTAAAAVGRMAGRHDHGTLDRSASKRSISTGDLAQLKARKRANSVEQGHPPPLPVPIMDTTTPRDEVSISDYFTPPESPIKDYKNHSRRRSNSLTNQSKKALNVLGQATKRVLTGTGGVSVQSRVERFENNGSPTIDLYGPEMTEIPDRRAVSTGTAFWRHKQGAKDWEDPQRQSSVTIRRRSGRVHREVDMDDDLGDDWDVETAIQQRVVQVMFTVPKEKLRVVNADTLSIISRSDADPQDAEINEEDDDVNRLSRVTEKTETGELDEGSTLVGSNLHPDSASNMKGKEKILERTESGSSGGTIGKAL